VKSSPYRLVQFKEQIGNVLKLRELVGSRASMLRVGEHPLALLFQIERKYLAAKKLTPAEHQLLGHMTLLATTLFEVEDSWRGSEERLASQLLDAKSYEPLMFELYVMTYVVRGLVGTMDWTPWAPGKDIVTTDPAMEIECELSLSSEIDAVFKKITHARGQSTALKTPFVIAIGFKDEATQAEAEKINGWCIEQRARLAKNDASAILVFRRTPAGARSQMLGVPTLILHKGTFVQIINHAATNPLPTGFGFAR